MRKFWEKYKKGVVVTALFVLFIVFLAPNNLIKSSRISREIQLIDDVKDYYREKSKEDSTFLENLKDDEFLEKYAREQFYMKRTGEEIYLIDN